MQSFMYLIQKGYCLLICKLSSFIDANRIIVVSMVGYIHNPNFLIMSVILPCNITHLSLSILIQREQRAVRAWLFSSEVFTIMNFQNESSKWGRDCEQGQVLNVRLVSVHQTHRPNSLLVPLLSKILLFEINHFGY